MPETMNAVLHIPNTLADVLVSAPVITSALLFSGAAMVLGVAGPTSADHYSVLGCLAALAIVIIYARKKDPSISTTIAVVSGTLVGGVAGPGATIAYCSANGYISAQAYNNLTFHSWVLLGFFFGLSGWAIAQAFYLAVIRHIPNLVEWAFRKFLPKDDTNP